MVTGKHQHMLPRFYLNRFIHPGWVYLRGAKQPKLVHSARNVAVKDWFYSPSPNGDLDQINTRIESETAPILTELLTTKAPLPDDSKFLFAYFIGNLALRVPAYIEEMSGAMVNALEQASGMAKKIIQKMEIEVEENTPYVQLGSRSYTYKEWNDFLESLRQQNKEGKALIETTMTTVAHLAPVIAHMSWVILTAPAGFFFVTCDRPVVLTDLEGSRKGAGWANRDAVGTLPLSPNRYLVLYGSPPDKWRYEQLSKEGVENFNSRTIQFAVDAIYSPAKYKPAENWLRETD
ncbi:MAG: DUF4238 domain-containing protein [Dehalococcoidia bacterium]|jgi:hypothetical protein